MRSFILLIGLCLSLTGLEAQKSWTLEACVRQAIATNINAELSQINIERARINTEQAKHSRYPNLNFQTGINWNFGRTIDPVSNEFSTETFFSNGFGLGTGVTLFSGGRIKNNIKQSEISESVARADYDQFVRDLSIQVANNYLNAIFALENKRISENQLKLSQSQFENINILIENGVRPKNESLEIQAQMARDNQNIIVAENNYQTALLQLKQLIRLDPSTEMELIIPDIDQLETSNPFLTSFEEVYQTALQTQPNIIAGDRRLESSKVAQEIAEGSNKPTLSFNGNLSTNYSNQGRIFGEGSFQDVSTDVRIDGVPAVITAPQFIPGPITQSPYSNQINDNLSYGFGFNLSVPIYNNLNVKSNIERAKLDIQQTKLNNEQIKDNLKISVQQALSDAQAAKLSLEASETSLKAQQASFENSEKRYELGAINSLEFVTSRNQLDNAQINLLIAKYDYIYKLKILEFYQGKEIKLN